MSQAVFSVLCLAPKLWLELKDKIWNLLPYGPVLCVSIWTNAYSWKRAATMPSQALCPSRTEWHRLLLNRRILIQRLLILRIYYCIIPCYIIYFINIRRKQFLIFFRRIEFPETLNSVNKVNLEKLVNKDGYQNLKRYCEKYTIKCKGSSSLAVGKTHKIFIPMEHHYYQPSVS